MKKLIFLAGLFGSAGWLAWERGSSEDVLSWSDRHKASPVSEKVEYYLGMCNYMRNDNRKAADSFSQLLVNHATSQYAPDALWKLAQIHYDANEFSLAVDDYLKFAELFPEHPKTESARQKVLDIKSR